MVALSATAATVRLVVVWWQQRRTVDDPLPAVAAVGATAAWLAVVPEQIEFGYQAPLGDQAGALVLIATLPLLVVAAVVSALRDHPGRFQGISHDVISWVLVTGAVLVMYAGGVVGVSLLLGGHRPVATLALTTAIIAVLADPVRRRIRDSAAEHSWP